MNINIMKMNRLYVFVVIFAACLHGSYGNYNFYEFTDECSAPGLMCRNCSTIVQCVETTPGDFEEILVQQCETAENMTCLNNKCSNEPNPRCNNQHVPDFVCTHTGMYPDPYDCKRYHICAQPADVTSGNPQQIDLKCLDNYGYDPVTTYCKTVLPNGVCPATSVVPACKEAGQSGPILTTSIYYICILDKDILVPHLYMCPHGKKYVNNVCK